jgi:hypothetical protein
MMDMETKPATEPEAGHIEKPVEKGAIQGEIKYPWGMAALAIVRVGDRSIVADRAGKYEIRDLEAGSHMVSVELPFPGYDAPSRNVVVAAGKTSVVDFYCDYARTTVHGYVYGQDGKPIAGAVLSDVKCGGDLKSTVTDATGYFKFGGASPGNLFVRVNAPRYVGETRDFVAKEGEKTKLEFHLRPGSCTISGIVTDEKGSPLGGEVFLSSESMIMLQKTPSNAETGYYEFSVVPGTYSILVNVSGYYSEGWRGSLSTDTKVDLKLSPMPESQEDQTARD